MSDVPPAALGAWKRCLRTDSGNVAYVSLGGLKVLGPRSEAKGVGCWARKRVPSAATTSTSVRRPFRNLAMALGFSARPPTSSIDVAVGAPSWRCV